MRRPATATAQHPGRRREHAAQQNERRPGGFGHRAGRAPKTGLLHGPEAGRPGYVLAPHRLQVVSVTDGVVVSKVPRNGHSIDLGSFFYKALAAGPRP